MKKLLCLLAFMVISEQFSNADVLVSGVKRYEGSFVELSNNTLKFEAKDGTTIKKSISSVKSLEITKPLKVDFKERSKKEIRNAELLGYRMFKFNFKIKGRKQSITGRSVKTITKSWSSSGTGMQASSEAPVPIAPLKFSNLEGAELSAEQEQTLAAYKIARADYDNFIRTNSKMMQQANATQGVERNKLLNDLRARRDKEQPIVQKLEKASNEAVAAFNQPL